MQWYISFLPLEAGNKKSEKTFVKGGGDDEPKSEEAANKEEESNGTTEQSIYLIESKGTITSVQE